MTVLWIVLPMALILASIGVWAFIWSVRSGQLDDLETPGVRLLIDDEGPNSGSEAGSRDGTRRNRGNPNNRQQGQV